MNRGTIRIAKGNDLPLCARLVSIDENRRPVVVPCEEVENLTVLFGMGGVERAVPITIKSTESNCLHFRIESTSIVRFGIYNIWICGKWRGNDVSQNYEGLIEVVEFNSRTNFAEFLHVDEQEIEPAIFIPAIPNTAEYNKLLNRLNQRIEWYDDAIEKVNAKCDEYNAKILAIGNFAKETTLGVPTDLGNGESTLAGMLKKMWAKMNEVVHPIVSVTINGTQKTLHSDESYSVQGYSTIYAKNHYAWNEVPINKSGQNPSANDVVYTTYTQGAEPNWVYPTIDGVQVKLDSAKTYKAQGYNNLYSKSTYTYEEVPSSDKHENELAQNGKTYYTTYTQSSVPSKKYFVGAKTMTKSEFNALTGDTFKEFATQYVVSNGTQKTFDTNKSVYVLAIPEGVSINTNYYINELGNQYIDNNLYLPTKVLAIDGINYTLYGFRDAMISETRRYYYKLNID